MALNIYSLFFTLIVHYPQNHFWWAVHLYKLDKKIYCINVGLLWNKNVIRYLNCRTLVSYKTEIFMMELSLRCAFNFLFACLFWQSCFCQENVFHCFNKFVWLDGSIEDMHEIWKLRQERKAIQIPCCKLFLKITQWKLYEITCDHSPWYSIFYLPD